MSTRTSAVAERPRALRVIDLLSDSRSFEMTQLSGRVLVTISISLNLCRYVVPFLRYSASKNGVTLKLGVRVVQGHWKWRRLIDHMTFYWSAIVRIVVCCIIFKLFDVESSWPWESHWRSFKLVPFESLGAVFYLPSIVTMAVSLTVYQIFRVKE